MSSLNGEYMIINSKRTLQLVSVLTLLALSACGSTQKSDKKVDYKDASSTAPLEVPPDLTSVGSLPGNSSNTFSTLNKKQDQKSMGVLPEISGARIQHSGGERWLEIEESPDLVWEKVQQFWLQEDIELEIDNAVAGIMETVWLENLMQYQTRSQQAFRRFLGSTVAAGARDKYRVRLERGDAANITELYLTHRGLERIAIQGKSVHEATASRWVSMPPNPELEAEMLRLIMLHMGLDEDVASRLASGITDPELPARAKLIENSDGQAYLELQDGYSRAWRRVGLALDRIGFTVEDRDRQKGVYYVRSFDPDALKKKKGFFGRLFTADKGPTEATKTEVKISTEGDISRVTVQPDANAKDAEQVAGRIIESLFEQLK